MPGERRVDGELIDVDENGITIATAEAERTLRFGEIRSARTTYAWGPTPKQGGQKNGAVKASAKKNTTTNAKKKGQPA